MAAPADTPGSATELAFVWACTLDVGALKPGNVSVKAPGHGMTAAQFTASAIAAAPAICARGATVGERILSAVTATRAAVDCNTNLGIVLLCAPIAAALESTGKAPDAGTLRRTIQGVLGALTVADSRAAFRAIALAGPGGLGGAEEQDVHGEPTVDLAGAMRLAQGRDLIARQYATGYADLFETGLANWDAALRVDALLVDARSPQGSAVTPPHRQGPAGARERLAWAMQRVFLAYLSCFVDSHIVRKHGLAVAQSVTQQAQPWSRRLLADAAGVQAGLARWDIELKAAGLNPGTSADLATATAFLAASIDPLLVGIALLRR